MEYTQNVRILNRISGIIGMLLLSYVMIFSSDLSLDTQGNIYKKMIDTEIDNVEVITNGFLADCQENPDQITLHVNTLSPKFSMFNVCWNTAVNFVFNSRFLTSHLQDIILPPPQIS